MTKLNSRLCMFCMDAFQPDNADNHFCSSPCLRRKIYFQTTDSTQAEIYAQHAFTEEEKKLVSLKLQLDSVNAGDIITFKPFDRNRLKSAALTFTSDARKQFHISTLVDGYAIFSEHLDDRSEALKRIDHILTFFHQ